MEVKAQIEQEIEDLTVAPADDEADANNKKRFNRVPFRQMELIILARYISRMQFFVQTFG